MVDKTTGSDVLISEAQVDIQSLVTMLRATAEGLVSDEESLTLGASISPRGELVVEHVPPAASSLERRKLLHRKLVGIAKSGQARAVAMCHSLADQKAFLVVSVDHFEDRPRTFLFRIEKEKGREHISLEPIEQIAAYTFFRFVDGPTAEQLLPGHWVKETERGRVPDSVIYHQDNSFKRERQAGRWAANEGDFFTNLLEFIDGSETPSRLARIISISPERVLLRDLTPRALVPCVYTRVDE